MKRIIKTALLCVICIMLALIPIMAGQVPTLFCNDEVWYRDAISPLIVKDGVCCVPAEMCEMFDGITVTMPRENNVLAYNSHTGGYISALIDAGRAAVNGEIIETEVFRSGGACYIDAELLSETLGLRVEYITADGEITGVRLSDGNELLSLDDVIANSTVPSSEEDRPYVPHGGSRQSSTKTLYIICAADSGITYSICDTLETYEMDFTCFIGSGTDDEMICLASSHGEIGAFADGGPDALDALNRRCAELTRKKIRAVLAVNGDDGGLASRGYAVITPDITVDSGTYAMGALRDAIDYLGDHDSCVIYVEASWNGREFIRLAADLDRYTFKASNIADAN